MLFYLSHSTWCTTLNLRKFHWYALPISYFTHNVRSNSFSRLLELHIDDLILMSFALDSAWLEGIVVCTEREREKENFLILNCEFFFIFYFLFYSQYAFPYFHLLSRSTLSSCSSINSTWKIFHVYEMKISHVHASKWHLIRFYTSSNQLHLAHTLFIDCLIRFIWFFLNSTLQCIEQQRWRAYNQHW